MSADCCMPRCREWCNMEAVGQWRPPWFIGGDLCVLPSFNLDKACSDVANPKSNQQPPPIHPIISMNNWWMRVF